MATATSQREYMEIENIKIEYFRKGQGQPLVVLHGSKDPVVWHPFHEKLSDAFDVIAPVCPGFGKSESSPLIEKVDDLAYFFLTFLKKLGLTEVFLVGADLGGWIAAEMAVRCTQRIKGLALVGAVGIKVSEREVRDIMDLNVIPFEDQMRAMWFDLDKGKTIMSNPSEMSIEDLEVYVRNQESEILYTFTPFMYNPNLRKRLHLIEIPTVVVWGEQDQVVCAGYGQAYAAEIPDSRYVQISQAGHLPHLEQAEKFCGVIIDFIGDC